jgi:hypothetical protein
VIFYPIISAIAYRLGGSGKKELGIILAVLPLLAWYGYHNGLNALILLPFLLGGFLLRRNIADSEDFPHDIPINLQKKQFINFDWLIGQKRKDAAKLPIENQRIYKLKSFTPNKMVIAGFCYVILSLFCLSPVPLLGIVWAIPVASFYYFCYNNWKDEGHKYAEIATGFYFGVFDLLLFWLFINKITWI